MTTNQPAEADDESFDPTDLYRTNPAATFVGHLFNGPDVRSAGVENGGKADHPVAALCSRRTDRGPFEHIDADEIALRDQLDDDDRDLCGHCLAMAARSLPAHRGAPFDPSEYTVAELVDHLDSHDYTDAELDAVHAAETDGKDRKTALDEIDKRRGDDA